MTSGARPVLFCAHPPIPWGLHDITPRPHAINELKLVYEGLISLSPYIDRLIKGETFSSGDRLGVSPNQHGPSGGLPREVHKLQDTHILYTFLQHPTPEWGGVTEHQTPLHGPSQPLYILECVWLQFRHGHACSSARSARRARRV